MSDDDLEQRIRTVLRRDAENARISPHAWPRVSARLTDARPRSHRGRSIGLAVAGAAALATVGAIVGPQLLSGPTGKPAERGNVLSTQAQSPSPEPTVAPAQFRELGSVTIDMDPTAIQLQVVPGEDGTANVVLAAYKRTALAIGRPPFAHVVVAPAAKPSDKIGVCQLQVRDGRPKIVTVSIAPAGEQCTAPVSYTLGATSFTRTS